MPSDTLERFKEVLDMWTARHFLEANEASQINNVFLSGKFPQIKRGWQNELGNTRSIALKSFEVAESKRFFHWDLEFPERFFGLRKGTKRVIDEKENHGFDVVIGNPPYIT